MSKTGDCAPYSVFAQHYDDLTGQAWSAREVLLAAALEGLPHLAGRGLDLACGTGTGAAWLVANGFVAVGVDISDSMLAVARSRVPSARFLHGDLSDLPSLPTSDVALCCFDSLNYLLAPADWRAAFAGIRAALRPGGRLVFDVVTPFDHRECWPWHRDVVERDGLVLASRGAYDAETGIATVTHIFFVRDGHMWSRHEEVHRQRAFTENVIQGWLTDAGFACRSFLDGDTGTIPDAQSIRWQFVAEAVG